MREQKAYTSVEGATRMAARAFGPKWAGLDALLLEVEMAARGDEIDQGLRRITEAGAVLKRAIPLVRQARSLAVEGVRAFDHLGDYWPEGEPPDRSRRPRGRSVRPRARARGGRVIMDLPDRLASMLEQLRSAVDAARQVAPLRLGDAKQGRLKSGLMRAAIRVGINVRPVDWAYAFIALGLDEPIPLDRRVGENRRTWRLRLIACQQLLSSARRSV